MSAAVRSRLNIGIAVAGAGVIALAPINPSMPPIAEPLAHSVSNAAVALSASTNPIEQWLQIINTTLANGGALAQTYLDNPLPILRQLILNGIGYGEQTVTALQATVTNLVNNLRPDNPNGLPMQLGAAWDLLRAGDIANGLPAVYGALAGYALFSAFPLINMVEIPIAMAQNFANVVQAGLGGVVQLALGVLSVPAAVVGATASQLQAVFDAVKAGDLLGTINEVLGVPGAFVGALLNGFGFNPGLLSPDGFVDIAIRTLNSIAEALGAAPVAAPMLAPFAAKAADTGPSALPSDPSTIATVTLDTDAGVTDGATQALATETTPDDTIVTEPVATEPVAEPLAAEPVATEPVSTEPVMTEPAATEPAVTEPAAHEPVATEPSSTEPATDTEAAAERESSKRELRTTMGASGGETGKAGVSRSAVGKKGESTTSSGSTSHENSSDSTDSGRDNTGSGSETGPSGNDSSGAAA
jgi:hypothetical protein